MEPLKLPASAYEVSLKGRRPILNSLRFVPVLGILVSSYEEGLCSRYHAMVCKQLQSRKEGDFADLWQELHERRIACEIGRVIMRVLCYPNYHFIPLDPLRVVLYTYHDDDIDDISNALLQESSIDLYHAFEDFRKATFGDMVSHVVTCK